MDKLVFNENALTGTIPSSIMSSSYIASGRFTLNNVPGYTGKLLCLENNPHMYCCDKTNPACVRESANNCARKEGGTIDGWDCTLVENYKDTPIIPQRYLIASWHMDESGVLVSDLSGMCLTWDMNNNNRAYQEECDEQYALIYDNGLMKVKHNTNLCIVPNLDDGNYKGTDGVGLKVDDCKNMQGSYWG